MIRCLLPAASLFFFACSANPVSDGELVYAEPHLDGNTFACETCHALDEPSADGLVRPGHPIGDSAARSSYKNGAFTELLDAVNTCRVEWMAATPWTPENEDWQALETFLEDRAPEQAPVLEIELAAPPVDFETGDAASGRGLFNTTCVVCHGTDAGGTLRAPALAGQGLDPSYVALRVRTSGDEASGAYQGLTGGRMPFWAADRLSDQDLIDIAAYVETSTGTGEPPDIEPGPDLRECGSTHPAVGSTATLTENFHDVGGTATIVDDCTVQIEGFTFDGTGINVQVYGGLGGQYAQGFSMSGDLRRVTPYAGESLTVQLPEGTSLDELDGLSVWCVPAGVDFGSGDFQSPS